VVRQNVLEKLSVIFGGERKRFVADIPIVFVSGVNSAQWNVLKLPYTHHAKYQYMVAQKNCTALSPNL